MEENKNPEQTQTQESHTDPQVSSGKPPKRHLVRPTWLRRTLKTLACVLVVIMLLPVLLYIPPVQTAVKNIACKFVYKSTGMKVDIGRFRLSFPLDVSLDSVVVLDQHADTMVRAKKVIADVKLLPLLRLDVRIKRLMLEEGYYRMVSPDSSMIMQVSAGLLDVDDKSSAKMSSGEISLNKALLRDGDLKLYMNVWKQKPAPKDSSSSTPFLIKANDLRLENFSFAMSMLPTIDTLYLKAADISLKRGVVDLGKNSVRWSLASVADGSGAYYTPTPEWVAAHPAPESEPSSGPPMQIKGDSISLDGFSFIYAMKGATPQPGFDASYIDVSEIALGMKDFYNESSTVRLPITRLQAKERSGLQIVSGKGSVNVDSTGLALRNLDIATLYSYVRGDADVPFALMELKPQAPVNVNVDARIGMPDIDSFMPAFKEYTSMLPGRNPLDVELKAEGSLESVEISNLEASLRDVLSLHASGYADNPLDIKKMEAELEFDGHLSDPRLVDRFMGDSGIKVPAFHLAGTAMADRENYGADFTLTSTAGNAAGTGHVGMNSEKYSINVEVEGLNVGEFVPSLGIGSVTAEVQAEGAGFNPLSGSAVTDARVRINSMEYNKREYRNIRADVILHPDNNFDIYAVSANDGLNLELEGNGSIHPDDYVFDIAARIRDLDLRKLGMSPEMNNGKGTIYISGTASPDRWLYSADIKLVDFDWNLPNQYIHLPGGLTARVEATENATSADVDSYMTSLAFRSPEGLKMLVEAMTKASDEIMAQVKTRDLRMDALSAALPPFTLSFNASGRGLLNQFMVPAGMSLDTVYGSLQKDSLFHGDLRLRHLTSGSIEIDTIGLLLSERRSLLDYRIHMGNRPGTMDEFAQVNLNGYLGSNRLGAFLTQRNLQGKTGYRIGLTAALLDSVVSVHFTPLKSTIAYLPWTLNDDNFIDYNIHNMKVEANLQASSDESSILLQTQPVSSGLDELHMKLENIKIEDFLSMSLLAPPVTGSVNSDLHVLYDGSTLSGKGTLGIRKLTYAKNDLGDFDLKLDAGMAHDGSTDVNAAMLINGEPAIAAYANVRKDSTAGMTPDSIGVRLTEFPLKLANPFLDNMATLSGNLNGEMRMDGTFSKPIFNGNISFADASVYIPMAGCKLSFDTVPVTVRSSVIDFDKFDIYGANDNPLTIDGSVNAQSLGNILLDLGITAGNCQLVKSDSRSKADLFGKLFINLDGTVKGSTNLMDIKAKLNILGTSDVTYRLNTVQSGLSGGTTDDVVKFVNFNDTTQVAGADSVAPTSTMRIRAGLTISPGTQATVLLSTSSRDRVQLQPSGTLNYFQNYMGDMRLNGVLTLGNGFARYSLPLVGEKTFTFEPSSHVTWTGDIMNPKLDIVATDNIKTNVTEGSGSRLVNFLVTLMAGGNLNAPKISFDMSTEDDASIKNELQSMSADQRQTTAMNLVLTGHYTGSGTKMGTPGFSTGMLYGYLASTINNWAAQNIRGVDLSFGVDQYDRTQDGSNSTQMSYSYQVSKSLFNNRFKIQVGGNYSTDASADENLSQNLISDISAEYILKQTETVNMSVKLFRHTGFESILEGEITETGAGFVMKRKLNNLLHLFRIRHGRKKENPDTTAVGDTILREDKDTAATGNVKIRKEDDDE